MNRLYDKNIVLPNYDRCILSTISSILKYYGISNNYNSLKELDVILKKKYKNVVMIVFDGMGENVLKCLAKDGIFRKNEIACVTSVFPSTTTAAMTSYYSARSPLETGWIAWTQYFKEYGRTMNMLPRVETYTEEKLKNVKIDVFSDVVNYKTIFEMLEENDVPAFEVVPDYIERKSKRTVIANDLDEITNSIRTLCEHPSEKFIFSYLDNPDHLLHKYGVGTIEVQEFLLNAEQKIKELVHSLNDAVVILSADHGHKNIEGVYSILDYPELRDCLIMPEFFESRFVGFWVKEEKKDEFEKIFNEKISDYVLLKKEDFLKLNLLGLGIKHRKIEDFLGNYVAISIGNSIFRLQNDYFEGKKVKASTHCGLTKEEMEVPVIVWECK